MNSINELNALMDDINSQISDSENIIDKKGYQYIAWYDYLKKTKNKLETETYKLVFVRQKGIGKTTTILELFGLNKNTKGKGYKNRVLDIYKNELTLFASMINVRDNYNSKWSEVVKENSLSSQIDNTCVPCTQTKDKE